MGRKGGKSGTEAMMNISSAVRAGAMAFLRREFKIVIPVAIALAIIIGFASDSQMEWRSQLALRSLR